MSEVCGCDICTMQNELPDGEDSEYLRWWDIPRRKKATQDDLAA